MKHYILAIQRDCACTALQARMNIVIWGHKWLARKISVCTRWNLCGFVSACMLRSEQQFWVE